jgi:predicted amidophosphoribosyltransferase
MSTDAAVIEQSTETSSTNVCSSCQKPATFMCSSCSLEGPRYCSIECQKNHWRDKHYRFCKAAKKNRQAAAAAAAAAEGQGQSSKH